MVSISKLLNNGLLLVGQSIYRDVATPEQAAVENFNIIDYLGGSAPYIQKPSFGISPDVPAQCQLQQVHLLSRHGERYPSGNVGKSFEAVYDKFKKYNGTYKGDLAFLNDYEYFVHDKNLYEKETTPSNSEGTYAGTTDLLRHGAAFRSKYHSLFNENQTLLVFTSNSGRVHVSSKYFARGFLGDSYDDKTVRYSVIDEDGKMGANSLTPRSGCKTYENSNSNDLLKKYDTSYLKDIRDRFIEANPGLNLTTTDVTKLFQWCAFEINVNGSSPFCKLFSNEEFLRYSYSVDLGNYYLNGPGNNLSASVGSQMLNATLTLLKDDKNPNKVWLSFTHDTDISLYYASLGIINPKEDLPVDHILFPNPAQSSQIVPQGARLYTEKLKCGNDSYVRFIVNDAVTPIESCQNGPGFSCKFSDFEKYVEKRLEGNSYADNCDAGDVPTKLTFYWDYASKNYSVPDINA